MKGLALLLLLSTAALAHGPGTDWIYDNPETRWCCSQRHGDCRPVMSDDVRDLGNGTWQYTPTDQTFNEGDRGLYPSRQLVPWICVFPDGRVRCLFHPPGGF